MEEKDSPASRTANNKDVNGITASPLATADVEDMHNNFKDPVLGSTQQHPFIIPENAQYWSNVYETAKYEGRHRFDPTCQWSATEEKRLVRKVCSQ